RAAAADSLHLFGKLPPRQFRTLAAGGSLGIRAMAGIWRLRPESQPAGKVSPVGRFAPRLDRELLRTYPRRDLVGTPRARSLLFGAQAGATPPSANPGTERDTGR